MGERGADGPTVLVIDDSEGDRALLSAHLRRETSRMLAAGDGRSGLDLAIRERPDAILLDLNLPGWDGFETFRQLKDDPATRSIPVLFLSSIDSPTARAGGLDLGAADFLLKSSDPQELCARLRAALRAKSERDLLERRAHLDGLTGLGNRHVLEERLDSDWAIARRRRTSLAILIADLDRFKAVNDGLGHQEGDRLLRETARALRLSVRGGDFLARYGGDEFVVVAHDCPLAGALAMGERFRAAVAQIPTDGPRVAAPTISIGVALSEPGDSDPSALLRRADAALYHAKSHGRDSVWACERGGMRPAVLPGLAADPAALTLAWVMADGVEAE